MLKRNVGKRNRTGLNADRAGSIRRCGTASHGTPRLVGSVRSHGLSRCWMAGPVPARGRRQAALRTAPVYRPAGYGAAVTEALTPRAPTGPPDPAMPAA